MHLKGNFFNYTKLVALLILIPSLCGMGICQTSEFSKLFKLEKKVTLHETDQIVLSNVTELDVDSNGDIWIVDDMGNKMYKFSQSNGIGKIIAVLGRGPNDVYMPESLYITDDGRVYVANLLRRVTVFDINGKSLDAFVPTDGHQPTTGVEVNSKNIIILAGPKTRYDEKTNKRTGEMIHLYTPEGKYTKSFYKRSPKLEDMNLSIYRSAYIALDKNDNIYAAQPVEYQVSVFDENGNFKRTIGHKNKYYKDPRYLPDKIRRDDKKLREFLKTFTYTRDALIFNGKLFVIRRNFVDLKNQEFQYFIDIYDCESGKLVIGGIETGMRLHRIKNEKFYFIRTVLLKEEDEKKILEIYRMKSK